MSYECITVEPGGDFVTVWMNLPERRNALSLRHMRELTKAFVEIGTSDALGVILAGKGPVFSAGHDFADMAGADLGEMRRLLWACTELMNTIQAIPQPVIARVHGLATAAGCQLVATADLAVAAETAAFAVPGGREEAGSVRPRWRRWGAMSGASAPWRLAMTGDPIDAHTAASGVW